MATANNPQKVFVFREGYVLKGELKRNVTPPKGGSVFTSKQAAARDKQPSVTRKKPVPTS